MLKIELTVPTKTRYTFLLWSLAAPSTPALMAHQLLSTDSTCLDVAFLLRFQSACYINSQLCRRYASNQAAALACTLHPVLQNNTQQMRTAPSYLFGTIWRARCTAALT